MRKESAETSDNKLKQMTKQERSKAMEQLKKKKKSHKREANKYAKSHGAKSRSLKGAHPHHRSGAAVNPQREERIVANC